ncbi:hypothetical protein Tco_0281975 [Tanacetum coccineum]
MALFTLHPAIYAQISTKNNISQELWRARCPIIKNHCYLFQIVPISKRRQVRCIIARLVIAACAYFIWQERNWRLFRLQKRMVAQWHVTSALVVQALLEVNVKTSKEETRDLQLREEASVRDESFLVAESFRRDDYN